MVKIKLTYFILFVSIVATFIISGLFIANTGIFSAHATTSPSQPFHQKNQQGLQSTINNGTQNTITIAIKSINNNSDTFANNTVNASSFPLTSNIKTKTVTVGDITIGSKTFGEGDKPIVLISGSGNVMDVWPPYFLQELSKTHKVIIFDNRGVGNTTSGTKPFSIEQFANDTADLMDALKIQKADVLGFSMASFIAQQLTLNHPEKVNRLVLYGASCGGQEGIPQNPITVKILSDFVNNQTVDEKSFLSVTFPAEWIKQNPGFLESIPKTSEIVPSTTLKKQFEINEIWLSKNWSGVCNQITKITQPTLIITGTDDVAVPSANSLVLAEKIPGAWLVQIREAGHGLMFQYPEKFTRIIETFLNETATNSQ